MKPKILLILTILGTILPNIFVIKESISSGNIMLYAHPTDTFEAIFVNNISAAFMLDLLFVVGLFLAWSYAEAKRLGIKYFWLSWLYTFAFGIAGGLPLFLYMREKWRQRQYSSNV